MVTNDHHTLSIVELAFLAHWLLLAGYLFWPLHPGAFAVAVPGARHQLEGGQVKESEYIAATNLAKATMAEDILRDMLVVDDESGERALWAESICALSELLDRWRRRMVVYK